MADHVLIIHGGGPTAVMNASLYGVIAEALRHNDIGRVYGALGGSEAVLKERFLDLKQFPMEKLSLLLRTPGTAIGSSRYALQPEDYEVMVSVFKKYGIKYVLLNGGNGTMDTCGHLYDVCRSEDIRVVGIPKTIDNDIAVTDHTPGFGSAARYLAASAAEVWADVKSLPIHVCIMEAMGRNAGWLTAASALARKKPGDGPQLIYVPERPFHEVEFLEDVKRLYREIGGVLVVVSEGLKNERGEPVVPPIYKTDRAAYYADVSSYLARLVIEKLGIKARSEKPGLCGRTSIPWQSQTDREEAVIAGRSALKAAIEGESGIMAGLIRGDSPEGEYRVRVTAIPIKEVMMNEKTLPRDFINERGNDVTEKFLCWCRPLIGSQLPEFIDFKEEYEKMGVEG